jgi:hypothetical protein
LIETQPELEESELRFICVSIGVAQLQLPSVQSLQEIPDDSDSEMDPAFVEAKLYPFKVEFGDDEVLFMLRKDDDFRTFVDGLEKRSLDTPTCVEVRRSPLGRLGLFTTKDCLPGDLLISERPMVSTLPALFSNVLTCAT